MKDIKQDKNKAGIYGDFISSISQKLVKVTALKTQTNRNRELEESNSTKVSNVSSGGTFDMYFELRDKYGQTVAIENNSKLFIR